MRFDEILFIDFFSPFSTGSNRSMELQLNINNKQCNLRLSIYPVIKKSRTNHQGRFNVNLATHLQHKCVCLQFLTLNSQLSFAVKTINILAPESTRFGDRLAINSSRSLNPSTAPPWGRSIAQHITRLIMQSLLTLI